MAAGRSFPLLSLPYEPSLAPLFDAITQNQLLSGKENVTVPVFLTGIIDCSTDMCRHLINNHNKCCC